MPTFERDGATIAYTDTRTPDVPVIVFGHGLLFSGWMFHPQVAALRDRYRCVTVDWRGQGDSPPAPGGYDMDTLTADAVALIRELGVAPVHWVGLSMGGFVGLRLAARHPELVRSLVVLDTTARGEEPAKSRRNELLARVQQLTGIRAVLGRVKPILFGPAFLADPASRRLVDEWVSRLVRVDRGGLRQAVLGVSRRVPVTAELAGITAKTLVIVGADDVATPPAEAGELAARIPGAELHVLPDCGHSSSLERPAAITGLLEEFFA
ncbi:alpha/beta fold hydrolase [Amycolatopsis sp. NPDC051903]|uniref:alpha/beta fold hydrolase n=1 Tax=Amycolatopsis sp. NPDC051903 TaxID=3363936 RepID=UPI0037A08C58